MSATQSGENPVGNVALGAGLLAGAANVIMQLSWPGVGYGVLESRVDSGNLFKRPVKRTRTTITYLAVATLGTDDERAAYRRAVNKQHAQVRSTETSPVRYHAMDPELQLWVAACLYKGVEDIHRAFGATLDAESLEELYQASASLGTTLQVRPEMWPADHAAFERYWAESLEKVSIDEPVRELLLSVATLGFLPRWLAAPFAGFNLFVTTGFLPQRFRDEMKLSWTPRDQQRFDRLVATVGALTRHLPRPLRLFPLNLALADLRLRRRFNLSLV